MGENKPYLSVVVVSRNDDHGNKLFCRMRACLDGLIYQLEKYRIPSELILVEWIPPVGKPFIKDVLPWPQNTKYCNIRVILVPEDRLTNYEWTETYAIRDLTPWNVGIKRAKGEFILSTVTDVLISDEMMQFFSKRTLQDRLYRVDRCDVNRDVLNIADPDKRLGYCNDNVVDKHTLSPIKYIMNLVKGRIPTLHDKAPGDFILLSKKRWHLIHGFPEGVAPGADNVLIYMAYMSGAEQYILKKPMRLFHIDHDSIWKSPSYLKLRKLFIKNKLPFPIVDVLSQVGSRFICSKSDLDKQGILRHSGLEIKRIISDISKNKRSYIYNDDAWGLGLLALDEFEITNNS